MALYKFVFEYSAQINDSTVVNLRICVNFFLDIPLEFHILESGTCHGLAFWFDVAFAGSQQTIWLSTGPTEPLTHWYQVRCLLEQPLLLKQGQVLTGRVLLVANKRCDRVMHFYFFVCKCILF